MDIDEARTFLRNHRHSVLHTFRSDGRPQLSPITHAVDDEGGVLVSSREPAYKVRNLERDPRATVMAMSDDFFGPWVQVDGGGRMAPLGEPDGHAVPEPGVGSEPVHEEEHDGAVDAGHPSHVQVHGTTPPGSVQPARCRCG